MIICITQQNYNTLAVVYQEIPGGRERGEQERSSSAYLIVTYIVLFKEFINWFTQVTNYNNSGYVDVWIAWSLTWKKKKKKSLRTLCKFMVQN